jgi:hypothetical protein
MCPWHPISWCQRATSSFWSNSPAESVLGADVRRCVGLKAPITVRDLHSEVRRDWKQLIGRKLAHTTAVKTGLGECPKKRGSPEN